jgi:hypothetical protein
MFIATMYLIRYQSDVLAVPIPAFRKQPGLFSILLSSGAVYQSLSFKQGSRLDAVGEYLLEGF